MDDILSEFKLESQDLLERMNVLLESIEEDPAKVHLLEEFALLVDRIMVAQKFLRSI